MYIAERSQYLICGLVLFALVLIFSFKVAGFFDVIWGVLCVPVVVYAGKILTKTGVIAVGFACGLLCAASFMFAKMAGSDSVAVAEFAAIMLTIGVTTWLVGRPGTSPKRAEIDTDIPSVLPMIVTRDDAPSSAEFKTVAEFSSFVAYEIRQPLCAAEIHAHAGLRWLNRANPDLDQARESFAHIIKNSKRSIWLMEGFDVQTSLTPDLPRRLPLESNCSSARR
jgi:hypothetical protein